MPAVIRSIYALDLLPKAGEIEDDPRKVTTQEFATAFREWTMNKANGLAATHHTAQIELEDVSAFAIISACVRT